MSERLKPPILPSEETPSEESRVDEFANYILAISEGQHLKQFFSPEEIESGLKSKFGLGDRSFVPIRDLLHRIHKDERRFFFEAIVKLLENPEIPYFVKASLIFFQTFPGGSALNPSIDNLIRTKEASEPVLQEAIKKYISNRCAEENIKYLEGLSKSIKKERKLTKRDYRVKAKELKHRPTLSRTIIDEWVVENDQEIGDAHEFFEFGLPLELRHCYLTLDVFMDEEEVYSITGNWYSPIGLNEALPAINHFAKSMLREEKKVENYPGIQYYGEPPGLYIQPDEGSIDRIHVPFHKDGSDFTYEELRDALSQYPEFTNYQIEECSMKILTPKGNQFGFTPFVADDPIRHPINLAWPQESRFFLQMYGHVWPEVTMFLIQTTSTHSFPVNYIESAFRKK